MPHSAAGRNLHSHRPIMDTYTRVYVSRIIGIRTGKVGANVLWIAASGAHVAGNALPESHQNCKYIIDDV